MEVTIPLFPCKSLHETIDFYKTLGFEITHQQEQPYLYAAVQRGSVEIHFSKLSVWKSNHAVCLVVVTEVSAYHKLFSDALRTRYGAVPTNGFPRITRFRNEHTRFHIFDPSGNTLIYIDQSEREKSYGWSEEPTSELVAAIQNAAFLRDTYCNDKAAATVLDKALAKQTSANPIDRARALAVRAELAIAMGEGQIAADKRFELRQVNLSDVERQQYARELQAADVTKHWKHQI